jgi:hypothetical protein
LQINVPAQTGGNMTTNYQATITLKNGNTNAGGSSQFVVEPFDVVTSGQHTLNASNGSSTVHVSLTACTPAPPSNKAPSLTLSNDITAEATSANGAVVTYLATADDAEDGNGLAATCLPASGSLFSLDRTTTVNCFYTDAGGLTASGSFTVTVQDTTAPDLTVPRAITAEATSASGATVNFTGLSAPDAVDANPSIACTADGNSVASGDTFALGTTQVSCTASDAAGNTSAAKTFDITVQDTIAPTLFNMPTNINAVATSALGAIVTYTDPTATDAVDANPTVSCSPASGSTFGLGATTVSCTAKDATGNTSAARTFSVTVAYGKSGILQPINVDGTSVFKLGSTIPVKFKLEGLSAGIIDATARITVAKQNSTLVSSWEDDTAGATTSAATTGNLFRYDASSDQYIFNLNTKSLSTGTFRITIDLADGSPIQVLIGLRK